MNSSNSHDFTSGDPVVDVSHEQLARTYAKAFLAATESLDQAGLVQELDSLLADVLDKFPDFNFYLTSGVLSHDERSELIDKVLGGRASEPAVNLLKVLSQNQRAGMLRMVVRTIHKMHGELNGRREIHVYTPHPLASDLEQGLRAALKSRLDVEADFQFHINPDLIGGMVVQVGDTVFDGSVRTTLERTRQQMVHKAVDAIESRPDKFIIDA